VSLNPQTERFQAGEQEERRKRIECAAEVTQDLDAQLDGERQRAKCLAEFETVIPFGGLCEGREFPYESWYSMPVLVAERPQVLHPWSSRIYPSQLRRRQWSGRDLRSISLHCELQFMDEIKVDSGGERSDLDLTNDIRAVFDRADEVSYGRGCLSDTERIGTSVYLRSQMCCQQ